MTYTYIVGSAVTLCFLAVAIPFWAYAGVFTVLFANTQEPVQEEEYISTANAQTVPLLRAAINLDPNPAKGGGDIIVSDGALVPTGGTNGKTDSVNSKTRNGEISVYVVREADTLSQIADMYDVSAKTILWANNISDPSKIHPGDTLVILPITGVRHVVKKGDTLKSIAKKYDGDVEDIIAYNQLASEDDISIGDTIVVPNGVMSIPAPAKSSSGKGSSSSKGSSNLSNPLPGAIKTQGVHGYNGVDLSGVPVGTPVLAAQSGEVIVAKSGGWNGGYGSYVVIKHANGVQTLYGHLSKVYVVVGQKVSTGTPVGGMGNTGRSTGPHLHFEVRGARNPF